MSQRSRQTDLFRGDSATGVAVPDPKAKTSIVDHVMYLGGRGRPTPYSSTTEDEDVADYFAGPSGRTWRVDAGKGKTRGVKHRSHASLVTDLRGYGKGAAKSTDPFLVAQARAYVIRWSEHLLDWSAVSASDVAAAVADVFK